MSHSIMKYRSAEWFRNTIAKQPAAMFHNTIAQKSAETAKNGFAKRNASMYLDTTTSISAAQLLAHQITAAQPAAVLAAQALLMAAPTKAARTMPQLVLLHKHLFSNNRVDHSLARARPKNRALAFCGSCKTPSFYNSVPRSTTMAMLK